MAQPGLAEWRFETAEGDVGARNRVEWNCKLNPYPGGEVRRFPATPIEERSFYRHRPIRIEVRLYLDGEYQTLVAKQAIIDELSGTIPISRRRSLGQRKISLDLRAYIAPSRPTVTVIRPDSRNWKRG